VHPDLEKLIRLQALDLRAEAARRTQAAVPERQEALEVKLEQARAVVVTLREQLSASQEERRKIEKDLAVVQGRLTRYKDQLMEVKTNREYHAMQHEIETAQAEVKRFEDQVLERMLESDELTAQLKNAEATVKETEQDVAAERSRLDEESADAGRTIAEVTEARGGLIKEVTPGVAALYEQVARARRGHALAEALDGHCAECHVRLRPQVETLVRRNDSVMQCDSCQRILYSAVPAEAGGAPSW
jgi:uncharacterized protein